MVVLARVLALATVAAGVACYVTGSVPLAIALMAMGVVGFILTL